MWKFVLPVLFSLLFSVPSAFGLQKSCVITLKNGNTIDANSCHVKGHRIFLKFGLGNASFDLSEVKSITGASGGTGLFQDKGKYQPPSPEEASSAEPDYAADPAQAKKEKKFDDFFNKYWQADGKTQAKMDKQMDKVFSDYFNTSEPSGGDQPSEQSSQGN